MNLDRVTIFPAETDESARARYQSAGIHDIVPLDRQTYVLQAETRRHIGNSSRSATSGFWCIVFDDVHVQNNLHDKIADIVAMRDSMCILPILITQNADEYKSFLSSSEYATVAHRALFQSQGSTEDSRILSSLEDKRWEFPDMVTVIEGRGQSVCSDSSPIVRTWPCKRSDR
jgi:hypothetical protein